MKQSVTDKAVLDKVNEIMSWQASYEAKYQALDQLWFVVANHHPQGMAADVLEVVSGAQRQTLYPEKGGDPGL